MRRTVTYYLCDGCGRTTLFDDIEIEREGEKSYHLCIECVEDDVYYCRFCKKCHNDKNLCQAMRVELDI
jgi:hypothetical protein